eukprot:TRINITY_DN16508_c0_g1_i1.p1 TRINITY_DN16508_c0_g1~~TRINITY_DN16508_c0_g1_i1.p1  ORF type:complete len:636 (-),score=79.98 TRINITY_DN16508_c0_g1_i1:9-1781(-)
MSPTFFDLPEPAHALVQAFLDATSRHALRSGNRSLYHDLPVQAIAINLCNAPEHQIALPHLRAQMAQLQQYEADGPPARRTVWWGSTATRMVLHCPWGEQPMELGLEVIALLGGICPAVRSVTVDFGEVFHELRLSQLCCAVAQAWPRLRHFDSSPNPGASTVASMARMLPRLEAFTGSASDAAVRQLGFNCSRLTRLSLCRSDRRVPPEALSFLLQRCTRVTDLTLSVADGLVNGMLLAQAASLPALRRLALYDVEEEHMVMVAESCTKVNQLIVACAAEISADTLHALTLCCPGLCELHGCPLTNTEALAALGSAAKLRVLDSTGTGPAACLAGCPSGLQSAPNVESLCVNWTSQTTEAPLTRLFPRLTSLTAANMQSGLLPSAVAWCTALTTLELRLFQVSASDAAAAARGLVRSCPLLTSLGLLLMAGESTDCSTFLAALAEARAGQKNGTSVPLQLALQLRLAEVPPAAIASPCLAIHRLSAPLALEAIHALTSNRHSSLTLRELHLRCAPTDAHVLAVTHACTNLVSLRVDDSSLLSDAALGGISALGCTLRCLQLKLLAPARVSSLAVDRLMQTCPWARVSFD